MLFEYFHTVQLLNFNM